MKEEMIDFIKYVLVIMLFVVLGAENWQAIAVTSIIFILVEIKKKIK